MRRAHMSVRAGWVAVIVVVAVAGCSPGPGNLTGKTTHGQFASGTASGDYAVAQAGGTVYSPSQVHLRLVATPPQSALVSWTMTCDESGGGVGQNSGQDTLQLPTIENLPLPAPSNSCIVAANAQLSESGTLNIALYNGNAPAASTSSTAPVSTTTTSAAQGPGTRASTPTTTSQATSASTAAEPCPNGTIGTGPNSAPASHEMVSGVGCVTVAQILRSGWVWRWGALMWGGTPGLTPGGNPPGWNCRETFEYFSSGNPTNQDDGSLTGSVTRCTLGRASFVVTMGKVTPWGHAV